MRCPVRQFQSITMVLLYETQTMSPSRTQLLLPVSCGRISPLHTIRGAALGSFGRQKTSKAS